MIDNTKDIIIAMINTKAIANKNDSDKNIAEVRKAIKEIKQEVENTKTIRPESN